MSSLTRRDFLRTGLAGSALLLSPALRASTPPPPQARRDDEPGARAT